MDKPYEILPHTADVGLAVRGRSMAELFEHAALGMTALLTDPEKIEPRQTVEFSLRSSNWESLLVDWLHEVLYYFAVKKMAFHSFKIEKAEPFAIHATAVGQPLGATHAVHREIKAVTYHHLAIHLSENGYKTQITFDI